VSGIDNLSVYLAKVKANPRVGTCERCGEEFADASAGQRRRFCSDNCRKRDSEIRVRSGVCATCGARVSLKERYDRCRPCYLRAEHDRVDARAQRIVAWWAEGLSIREIGERLGRTANYVNVEINRLRSAGYDLPFRYPAVRERHERQAA
jgi:transposase-like protein